MALASPALAMSVEVLFENVKPTLDAVKKLGITDFSAAAPMVDVKPGTTIKYPVASITAASAYNDSSNNYLTGGTTTWGTLEATHYLQGFDLQGENIDQGVAADRIKQIFAARAGSGIAAMIQSRVKTALDSCTDSTAVTLSVTPTLKEFMAISTGSDKVDGASSTLALNGSAYVALKGLLAAGGNLNDLPTIAGILGVKDVVLVPGMTARAALVPQNAMGFLGRVPTILAKYVDAGVEVDPDSGLAVGIVVAEDQSRNRQVVNADLWFGTTVLSANAGATTAGIIKVA